MIQRMADMPGLAEGQQRHPGRKLTEREFLAWVGEKTRAEWVGGEVVMMAPVADEHSLIVLWLARLLGDYVEHHDLGVVHGPEYLCRLPRQRRQRLPDLLFVSSARAEILRRTYVEGPPDLIVEVASEDSIARDYREKYADYEKAGVREYWIVDPLAGRIEAHALPAKGRARKYRPIEPKADGRIESTVLRGLWIKPAWIFSTPRAKVARVLKELGVSR